MKQEFRQFERFKHFERKKFNLTAMETTTITDMSGQIKQDSVVLETMFKIFITTGLILILFPWIQVKFSFVITFYLSVIEKSVNDKDIVDCTEKEEMEVNENEHFWDRFITKNEAIMNVCFFNSKSNQEHVRMSDDDGDDKEQQKDKQVSESKLSDSNNNDVVKCTLDKVLATMEQVQKDPCSIKLKYDKKNVLAVPNCYNVKINGSKEESYTSSLTENTGIKSIFSVRNIVKLKISVYHLRAAAVHPPDIDGIPWPYLKEEKWRLHTFAKYPHKAQQSAIMLAGKGFAYLGAGNDDNVICYFCCIKKQNWKEKDNICNVHAAMSPKCPMVTGINCTNVPMMKYYPKEGFSLFSKLTHSGKSNEPTVAKSDKQNEDIEEDGMSPSNQGTLRSGDAIERNNVPKPSTSSANSGRPSSVSSNRPSGSIQMAMRSVGPPVSSSPQQRLTGQAAAVSASHTVAQQVSNGNVTSATVLSNGLIQSNNTDENNPPGTIRAGEEVLNPPGSHSSGESVQSSASASRPDAVPVSNPAVPAGQEGQTGSRPNSQNPATPPATAPAPPADPPTDPPVNTSQPTYSQLGIMTERPKRFEYAVRETRLQTFDGWPPGHKLKPADLADAGFYYAGYSDCARCFFCGGGLRNWEPNDNVWVEHARWFPKCTYIRQNVGQAFVTAVEQLNKIQDDISYDDVMRKLGPDAKNFHLDSKDNPLLRDPAVRTVLDSGFRESDVFEAANALKSAGETLSSDKIYEKLLRDNKPRQQVDVSDSRSLSNAVNNEKDIETIKELKSENGELRKQTVCKVCWDKEVTMVFLPCGHFVSCTDCTAALRDCPMCRTNIKGVVRAYMN